MYLIHFTFSLCNRLLYSVCVKLSAIYADSTIPAITDRFISRLDRSRLSSSLLCSTLLFSSLLKTKKKGSPTVTQHFHFDLRSTQQEAQWGEGFVFGCVSIASLSVEVYVFLAAFGSGLPSVFESIKYPGPIHLFAPCSVSLLTPLPICFSPHPFLHLVALPVSPIPVLLCRSISLCHCLSARFFFLFFCSGLAISERQRHPCFSNPCFFYPPLSFSFCFLSFFLRSPPLFSVSVSLGSAVIKSDSSQAENNKQQLLKFAMAV